MKQTMRRLYSALHKDGWLIAACYGVFFAVSFSICVAQACFEWGARAMGVLREHTLTISDFELVDLQQLQENVVISTTPDPRMIVRTITDKQPMLMTGLRVFVEFTKADPGEFCVFYKPRPNMEEFDANYRVWAKAERENVYSFALPQGKIYGLRIDPGIFMGVQAEIKRIVLNPTRDAVAYLMPTLPWVFAQAVLPLLAAALVKTVRECAPVLRIWKIRKKHTGR